MFALSQDQLRSVAPSIFTRSAYHTMSSRYKVAATADVVHLLEGIGLFPVRAQQSRCRLPDKKDYVRHLIRFRRSEDMAAGLATEIPEVVLTNSFDGSSAYCLECGLYRVACLNGLVCPTTGLDSIRIPHKGGDDFGQRIIEASYRVVEQAPTILNTIEEWKGITLTRPQQLALASAATEIKPNVRAPQLLTSRRPADDTDSDGNRNLWVTTNVIQEQILKGGIQGKNESGRRFTTRPIKSVSADITTNRAIWRLSQEMALLVK